jgi:ABC-type amino acid transport substrate-binding protein
MRRQIQIAYTAAACFLVAALTAPSDASARTLAQIKHKGAVSLCANPDALPFSSDKADPPGFQIEIARAIAAGLGVKLEVQWIAPRTRANLVNCDILLDSIDDRAVYEGKLLLSRPYQSTGVALAVGPKTTTINGFAGVQKGQKVGVMTNSLTQVVLGKKGISQSPYAFEQEMLDDLAKGQLYGVAASPATIAYYIRQHPESGMRLVHAYDSDAQLAWNVSVGMRNADQPLVDAINEVLERLLADGTIAAIYGHYGVEHRAP